MRSTLRCEDFDLRLPRSFAFRLFTLRYVTFVWFVTLRFTLFDCSVCVYRCAFVTLRYVPRLLRLRTFAILRLPRVPAPLVTALYVDYVRFATFVYRCYHTAFFYILHTRFARRFVRVPVTFTRLVVRSRLPPTSFRC